MVRSRKHNNIKRYRRISGYSQVDVALVLGIKNTATISRWERGYLEPSVSQLFMLAALFNTTPQELYAYTWQEQENVFALMKAAKSQKKKQTTSTEIFYL